jgi:serine/threonine-protein kinase HipA
LLKGKENETEWLNERELAERLHILRNDHTAWRLQSDTGQFSLAGAQPKTALLYDKGRWGIPSGRTPTTHILKPPTGTFDGHAENEHICLALARAVGLPAANSQVLRFEKEIAIAVERYDRQRSGKKILRVHQEDMCQSLGIMPTRKYQNEGGPGIPSIVELLRTHSSAREEDVNTFVGAVGFNWLIAGTDAHAKNYSVLIADGSRVRLAPLYDVASILPYDEMDLRAAKLAMKIGDEYLLTYIGLREWQKLARQTRVNADELIIRLREMSSQLPDEINSVRKQAHTDGLARAIVDRMAARLVDRAKACQRKLANGEQ